MVNRIFSSRYRRSELLIPPLVFIIIAGFAYAYFFREPYLGFTINPASGEVAQLYVVQTFPGNHLKVGDILVSIGGVSYQETRANLHTPAFSHLSRGSILPLIINRGGQPLAVRWIIPGASQDEVRYRIFNTWWLAIIFWLFGTATYLFIRPKDARWRLLAAFNYITALWIISGMLSPSGLLYGPLMFRVFIWLAVPIYIHLHWIFPVPLGPRPRWLIWLSILAAAAVIILQIFELIPLSLAYLGFTGAVLTSIILTVVHYVRQPNARRTISMVMFAALFSLGPAGLLSLIRLANTRYFISTAIVLTLPLLPAIYFFAIYRRQIGGTELRANRLISLYLFLITLVLLVISLLSIVASFTRLTSTVYILATLLPMVTAVLAVTAFPPFQRWVENRLLGIPNPPTHLVEMFAARISTSPDPQHLVQVLRDNILRSLMVRQSALLCYDEAANPYFLYKDGLDETFNPHDSCLDDLWDKTRGYIDADRPDHIHPALGWVRMVIPLVSGSRRIGLWLLGRRDPDDFYATIEIPTLQALADQMAVAVLNHEQSEHLSRLYQVDIDRQEAERRQLALELHDGVLNQLGILSLTIEDDNPTFESAYQLATTHIRQIISGLRPTMLNYGLRTALDELADETPSHNHSDVKICVDMAETDIRYSPQVELHLYRIAQEACKNAIQHANAQVIRITGMLEPDSFDLTVADDGIGFARGQQLELNDLLANKHFGLAGMIERARLIGAQMEISSHPGRGTRVRVYGTCGHPC